MSGKELIRLRIIFCCLLFISCGSDSFYTRHYIDDLQRIPLIKPYELLNQRYADSNYHGTHGWELRMHYHQFEGYISHLNISYVNVSKGIIYGHGKDGSTGFPNYWFVIVPDKKSEEIFKTEKDWKDSLESKGINAGDIFSVWAIFRQYEDDSILPWYNSGRNIYP